MRRGWCLALASWAAATGAAVCTACSTAPSPTPPPQVTGGIPARDAQDITQFGCGSCHVIPGVRGAVGTVGPPLTDFRDRGYIAGELSNNADNLVLWIMHPRAVEPGTDMPDLGVSDEQARDIAAYLYTLGK